VLSSHEHFDVSTTLIPSEAVAEPADYPEEQQLRPGALATFRSITVDLDSLLANVSRAQQRCLELGLDPLNDADNDKDLDSSEADLQAKEQETQRQAHLQDLEAREQALAERSRDFERRESEMHARLQELRKLESALEDKEKEVPGLLSPGSCSTRPSSAATKASSRLSALTRPSSAETKEPPPHFQNAQSQALALLSAEVQDLKQQLEEQARTARILESQRQKEKEDYIEFIKALGESSATPFLGSKMNLDSADILGAGKYSYVFRCEDKKSKDKVVVKVTSARWTDSCAHEWAISSRLGKCPRIIRCHKLFLHREERREVERLVARGFENGDLTGKRPALFPAMWFGLYLEHADGGSLQALMERGPVGVGSAAAMAQQVAAALAFMHKKHMTHNDVKPRNVLFCKHAEQAGVLVAKLADLGSALHSVDRARDCDLHSYMVWCAALQRSFSACEASPNLEERQGLVDKFLQAQPKQASAEHQKIWRALASSLRGVWQGTLSMQDVELTECFQACQVRVPEKCQSRRLQCF